ncbi:MAG: A24 family peptidase [Candidatus Micrarchaeota archaeon]
MLEFIILFFIALVFYFDLKARIIPDPINFFFMFLAIALTIMKFEFELGFLAGVYLPFFLLNLAFAYLLYRLGVWAGGDVKFFTALMAFLPLYSGFKLTATFSVFLTSALLLIPITILYYINDLVPYRREFHKLFIYSIIDAARSTVLSFSVLLAISFLIKNQYSPLLVLFAILLSFFIRLPFKLAIPLAIIGLAFFRLEDSISLATFLFFATLALHLMRRGFHLLSEKVLKHPIAVRDLEEGAIPAETYYLSAGKVKKWAPGSAFKEALKLLKGRGRVAIPDALAYLKPKGKIIADALKARGVTSAEIKELKRLHVKEILVKEALPFAPVIAAAFLLYKYWDFLSVLGIG